MAQFISRPNRPKKQRQRLRLNSKRWRPNASRLNGTSNSNAPSRPYKQKKKQVDQQLLCGVPRLRALGMKVGAVRDPVGVDVAANYQHTWGYRSEERRVGKESRGRRWTTE